MKKTANCIRMLKYLGDHKNRYVTTNELCEFLDVDQRTIRNYRRELEDVGYRIESMDGIYGGLKLETKVGLPFLPLSQDQYKSLIEARNYMLIHKDFPLLKEFNESMMEIHIGLMNENESHLEYLETSGIQISQIIKQACRIIEQAIKEHKEIEFEYKNSNGDSFYKVRLQPYRLFYKDSRYYINGYGVSFHHKEYRNFMIHESRMKNVILVEKPFALDPTYRLEDHVGKCSVMKGEEETIVLKVNKAIAYYVLENSAGYNYSALEKDDYILVETTFDNIYKCNQYILSLGNNVEVLSPTHVRERIQTIIEKMYSIYQSANNSVDK